MIKIDDLSKVAIDSLMTPGMRVLVARKGKIVYDKTLDIILMKKTPCDEE